VAEVSQFARRLAASRCRVLVPLLLDRRDTYSGHPDVRMTNQPHREFIYMFTGEYDMFEFDLGHTFNYAERSWLICPRPFMVERGHHDGVAPDEWVA
jgi:hypothetical protein